MKNFGFVEPVLKEDNYVLGAVVNKTVLMEDGQWDEFLPDYEPQFGGDWDTYGCTVWGTENALEILDRFYSRITNYSERYPYILANVKQGVGADPHNVAEVIRENGLIPDDKLPMTKTYPEFVTPKPMSEKFLNIGKSWLKKFEFKHEYLWWSMPGKDERIALIKDALKYSPLGCSVTAWYLENGLYVDKGRPNNHWCVIYGWTDRGWKVFDSYLQCTKIVSFDHKIKYVKSYFLFPKGKEKTTTLVLLLTKMADAYRQLLEILKKKK